MALKALKAHTPPRRNLGKRTLSTLSTLSSHIFALEIAPRVWTIAAGLPTASERPPQGSPTRQIHSPGHQPCQQNGAFDAFDAFFWGNRKTQNLVPRQTLKALPMNCR
jgi:hypothetical protein